MSEREKISLLEKKFLYVLISLIISFLFIGLIIFLATPGTRGILFGLEMPDEFISHFIVILPGPMWTDILLIYGLPIGIFCIAYYISQYTNRGFAKVHSFFYIFRKKPSYGIYQPSTRIYSSKLIFRSIIVCLLSFLIAWSLVELGFDRIFRYVDVPIPPPGLLKAEATFLGTFFFLPFVLMLFFILWALEDSGIVAYRIFSEKRKNPDINGVYKIFKGFIEYVIGFSILIAYYDLTNSALQETSPGDPAFLIPLILFFLPFILSGFLAIPIFLYEKYFKKMMDRVHPYLINHGFKKINIPEFESIEIR